LRMFCCFSFNISFYLIFAFFFLLSQKKEEKCSQKEERKTVVGLVRHAETRSHKQARGFSYMKYCRVATATP